MIDAAGLGRPARPRRRPTARAAAAVLAGALAVAWPWMHGVPIAVVNDAVRAAQYALVGVSLVLLVGWVGQISLAQGSFVGIGAYVTALLFRATGVGFPFSVPLAIAVSCAAAVLLGTVALRVRGLYLAVATMIFAWLSDKFLFSQQWLVGAGGSASIRTEVIGRPGGVPSFDLTDPRIFYLMALGGLALALFVAANLRDSKTGRAFFAIRGSEVAAASLGVDVTRYKLLAFAVSGALAGLAGNLQIVGDGSVVPSEFDFLTSLFFLSVAVVGGLDSLAGAVLAGVIFSALNELFFRVTALNGYIDLVSGLLLLGVLLAYPGGLAMAIATARHRLRRAAVGPQEVSAAIGPNVVALPSVADSSREEASPPVPERTPALPAPATAVARSERAPVLEAVGISVRFGGLVAVDQVSLEVRQGEIVGLIGPNGAGKTTLFNAVTGLNSPSAGTVRLFGKDVTHLPVHLRAALGVGRTFQLVQLFPQLDVFDNLLAATHLDTRTGFLRHVAVTHRAVVQERQARTRVAEVIERFGLQDVARRAVSGLPFGVLRTVELARALVTGARFIMLDEPASGLDNAETERLSQRLLSLRADEGLTLLLIEHDVPMVTRVCDHVYVINRGRPLAEGSPAAIQRNHEVVAAYLGSAPVAATA